MAMPVSDPKIVCVGSGLGQNGSTSKRGACTVCAETAAETVMSATNGSSAFDFIGLSRVTLFRTSGVILRCARRAGQRLLILVIGVALLVMRPTTSEAHEIPGSVAV